MGEKFSFGASSVMREVPPGQTAVIKFNGKAEKVETDWGDKFALNAFFVLFIVPFLPYEVDAFTTFIPALTALLNLLLRLLGFKPGIGAPKVFIFT